MHNVSVTLESQASSADERMPHISSMGRQCGGAACSLATWPPPITVSSGRNAAIGMSDNGDDVTMTPRLGPQYAKAILDIMVRDALDETGKNFLRLIFGRMFHSLHSRDAGLNVAT